MRLKLSSAPITKITLSLELDQEIFNIMLAESMHQIARIEFKIQNFPTQGGAAPFYTLPGGQPPGTLIIGQQFGPPLSSGWIHPCFISDKGKAHVSCLFDNFT